MAKPKRRHLSSISARKKPKDLGGQLRDSTRSVRSNLRPSRLRDESEDDSWIEVKKQRVIIIIPALPKPNSKPRRIRIRDPVLLAKNNQKKQGNDAGSGDKKATARQDLPNSALELLGKDRSAAHERTKEGGKSTNAIDGANYVYAKRKWNSSKCNVPNKKKRLVDECSKQMLYKTDQPISSMDILLASALDAEHADSASWQDLHRDYLHVRNSREDLSLDTADSCIERKDGSSAVKHAIPSLTKSVISRETRYPIQRVVTEPLVPKQIPDNEHATSLLDACVDKNMPCSDNEGKAGLIQVPPILTANQAFRVSILKKHLDKVGGLGKWLCLVGLDQFQDAFEKRIWSEVELLKLNMEDLKAMGKSAVGPRRKLIWAIQRLSRQLI